VTGADDFSEATAIKAHSTIQPKRHADQLVATVQLFRKPAARWSLIAAGTNGLAHPRRSFTLIPVNANTLFVVMQNKDNLTASTFTRQVTTAIKKVQFLHA